MLMYSEAIKETILRETKAKCQGNNQYVRLCPVHGDTNPSLAIKFDGRKVLFHCHAGCHHKNIEDQLKKKWKRKRKLKKL